MASMRDWLKGPEAEKGRVVVVHCKAGKGRSGTVATSYLVSEEGWSVEDAMLRFTARRMRSGFGSGISIPSQIRWVGYTDWWTKHGKVYVERQIEILEVHVWGLRDGVKVAIEGYVEEGRIIKTFHTFSRHERTIMDDTSPEALSPVVGKSTPSERALPLHESKPQASNPDSPATSSTSSVNLSRAESSGWANGAVVLFRPSKPLILPSSDINVDLERRNNAKYGLTMVTSVAHVWFNAFFESQYALQKSISNPTATPSETQPQSLDPTNPPSNGVFSIHWDAMDGIKGSSRKGTRALDSLSVVWRAAPTGSTAPTAERGRLSRIITQPTPGEPIPESGPANRDNHSHLNTLEHSKPKNLGLRVGLPHSQDVSRAASPADYVEGQKVEDDDSEKGIKASGPNEEEFVPQPDKANEKDEGIMVGFKDATNHPDIQDLPESSQKMPGQLTTDER